MSQSPVMGSTSNCGQPTFQHNANDELPVKRKKRAPAGTPTGKSIVVLKKSDVVTRNELVYMPNTIEMAQIKKPEKGQFKTNVQISSRMTEMDIKRILVENFPFLEHRRFWCAAAVDNRTRLDFHGERRIWDGRFLKRIIKGNSTLYIFTDEQIVDKQDPKMSEQSTLKRSHDQITTLENDQFDQASKRIHTVAAAENVSKHTIHTNYPRSEKIEGIVVAQPKLAQEIISTASDQQSLENPVFQVAEGSAMASHEMAYSTLTSEMGNLDISKAASLQLPKSVDVEKLCAGKRDQSAHQKIEDGHSKASAVSNYQVSGQQQFPTVIVNSNQTDQIDWFLGASAHSSHQTEEQSNIDHAITTFMASTDPFPELDVDAIFQILGESGQGSSSSDRELTTSGISDDDGLDSSEQDQNLRTREEERYTLKIDPNKVSMKGGRLCELAVIPMSLIVPLLTSEVLSVEFVHLQTVQAKRCGEFYHLRAPPAQEPGWYTVILRSHNGERLGTTQIEYVNEKEEFFQQLVKDPKEQQWFIVKLLSHLGGKSEISSGEKQNSGNLGSTQAVGSTHALPAEVLQLLVYAVAKVMFNSSPGNEIVDSHEESAELPEFIARSHGHEDTAHYLEDVITRISKQMTTDRFETIDWSELMAAAETAQERHGLSVASGEENHQPESDENSDYYGDVESLSCDSSEPDSEDDFSEMFSKVSVKEDEIQLEEDALEKNKGENTVQASFGSSFEPQVGKKGSKRSDANAASSSKEGGGDPPQLSTDVPSMCNITVTAKHPHLPVDVLLVTGKDCEFLACYNELTHPNRCWFDDLGYVYFSDLDDESQEEKVKIALLRCYKGGIGPWSLISVKNAVHVLRPKAVISVGTCSALNPEETKLGDVVVSAKIATYAPKVVESNQEQSTGMRSFVSRRFLDSFKDCAVGWQAPLKNPEGREIQVHSDGEFLSGPEQVSAEWRREQLAASNPQAIAIEMEGEDSSVQSSGSKSKAESPFPGGIISEEENYQVESEEISDTGYLGVTLASDSSQLSGCNSVDDDSVINFAGENFNTVVAQSVGARTKSQGVFFKDVVLPEQARFRGVFCSTVLRPVLVTTVQETLERLNNIIQYTSHLYLEIGSVKDTDTCIKNNNNWKMGHLELKDEVSHLKDIILLKRSEMQQMKSARARIITLVPLASSTLEKNTLDKLIKQCDLTKKLIKISKSVGAAFARNKAKCPKLVGTCFGRVTQFLITNTRVWKMITTEANVFIHFNFEEGELPSRKKPKNVDCLIVRSEKLDYAILKMKEPSNELPPCFSCISIMDPSQFQCSFLEGQCVTLIGHPHDGQPRQTDLLCPVVTKV